MPFQRYSNAIRKSHLIKKKKKITVNFVQLKRAGNRDHKNVGMITTIVIIPAVTVEFDQEAIG